MHKEFIELVEGAAKARGEASIPREYIVDALEIIERKEADAERYPGGVPSMKDVFDLAVQLKSERV